MNNVLPQNFGAFLWHFLKPYKVVVIAYIVIALLAGCWGPFNSMLIKQLINTLSSSRPGDIANLIWPGTLLVVNFIVFDNFTWRSLGYLDYKYQAVIKTRIISDTFRFVLGSSHQYFHDNLSGRIASQINTLADNIERLLSRLCGSLIRGISLVIVVLASAYSVSPTFSFIMLVWFIVFSTFSIRMSKRLVTLSDRHTKTEAEISGQLVDSISNMSNIGLFARRFDEVRRLDHSLKATKQTYQKKECFFLTLYSIQGAMIATMLGFVVYFLIQLYGKHLVTIGDFALILGLSMELAHMTWFTMSQVAELNQAVGKCKQCLDSLIVPQDIQDKKDATTLSISKGQITFEGVKFHYKNTEPLFQNKTVTIEAGQKVGLVGSSGGGKSTFVNLILRLYDVTDGQIIIDGHDIRDVTQESLRRNIAMIPQDPTLFHRSLMENIRYGRIEATDEDVIAAAKKAHAHDFIYRLPLGYESPVGERGVKLSGGQRQRIAIARAILKNAPILILDEATSQLDSVTERDIQESLWELMQDKTTIVIAHRLSTLLHMDRILVFDHGKIAEDGTHAELLASGGLYKTLWDAQVGGFLLDNVDEVSE